MLELQELAKLEEISWRQRSKFLWIKAGDKNIKFFHKIANAYRRYNKLRTQKFGELVEDQEEIKGKSSLFTTICTWSMRSGAQPTTQIVPAYLKRTLSATMPFLCGRGRENH